MGLIGWGTLVLLTVSWALLWSWGVRLNTSSSIPLGLWRERPLEATIQRGDVVSICPGLSAIFRLGVSRGYLNNGWCRGGMEILFKPVAAVSGDIVIVGPSGITVNGLLIRNSAALPADSNHRPLPAMSPGTYVVGGDQLWLVSDTNDHSFDSRYFGPMTTSGVRGILKPLALNRAAGPKSRSPDVTEHDRSAHDD
jgi:conjugative transfer signal peptidase TraF